MNLAFYGHTNTLVFTYTKDGKFNKQGLLGGIRQLHYSAKVSLSEEGVKMDTGFASPDETDYRKDYYGLKLCQNNEGKMYYGISASLGYEEGTTPGDIFMETLSDKPIDCLFVWDEGYGGLSLSDYANVPNVLWASDKALPDRQQFSKIADKCFLFLDGNILRKAGAMISRQISWERTASELLHELQNNPAISYLLGARYLLVSFGLDGAVFIVPKKDNQLEAALILTHGDIEGTLSDKNPGQFADICSFLLMTCMFSSSIAGLAAMAEAGQLPKCEVDVFDWLVDTLVNIISQNQAEQRTTQAFDHAENDAVKWGSLLRIVLETGETIASTLIRQGAGVFDAPSDDAPKSNQVKMRDWAAFHIPLTLSGQPKSAFKLPSTRPPFYQVPDDWTVINNIGKEKEIMSNPVDIAYQQLFNVAFDYVQHGGGAIDGLPQFSLGALTTVDRWEIESYQNIRNLILDYDANINSKRPLSIAVFGSPGSGKSFGVTEIATNILPGKVRKLEFNVSQFVGLMDLGAAFQKVRDVILGGKLPLVFFDEFDSDKDGTALGWIKSFLMPMQDGRFRDESGEHPLGKCILVFAGGTAASFDEFTASLNAGKLDGHSDMNHQIKALGSEADYRKALNNERDKQPDYQSFKAKKGPDFVSRLRGTLNVAGPNPKDSSDLNHILRRALLLRSLCKRDHRLSHQGANSSGQNNTHSLPVSPNIIRAMLLAPEFRHGARSMEAILDMSRIEGGVWEPANLPFRSQLDLHVDADAFLGLVAYQ